MVQRILVPVDGSPPLRRGLAEAVSPAKPTGARPCPIHAVDDPFFATPVRSGAR